ncbi:unnamed protein product [Ectocarpus sp. 6 AP-2014]
MMEPKTSSMGIAPAVALLALALQGAMAQEEDGRSTRPLPYKKWRTNPKMVVFGDSQSDAGRRYNAPASHVYEGIGVYPWPKLYEAPDSESKFRAFLPGAGSMTNGKMWPEWLNVPQELNFATATASATETFRTRETCQGYTGEGEDLPTGTLDEQITRYFNDADLHETADYTHIIYIGNEDLNSHTAATVRYSIGGEGYVDPYVPFDLLFDVADDGTVTSTHVHIIAELAESWRSGITRLIDAGVTGTILLGNIGNPEGLSIYVGTPLGEIVRSIALTIRAEAQAVADEFPDQVRILDNFTLFSAIVDTPEIFENLGFVAPEGSFLSDPCLDLDFAVDYLGEVAGTQALRPVGCQEECALCADDTSPCGTCFEGNPSGEVCSDPDSRLFWGPRYFSTAFHHILGEAIRQCSKDSPNYDRPVVLELCGSSR